MKYNPEIHHRRSIRLKGYDYSQNGAYFITICVKDQECLFGKIENDAMVLNDAGKIAQDELVKTSEIRKNMDVDCFVVMPNHVHAIVVIDNPVNTTNVVRAYCNTPLHKRQKCNSGVCNTPLRSPSNNLGSMVRGYKSTVTTQINNLRNMPGELVWQRNYHEHIIRDEKSYEKIWDYILHNPQKWADDMFFVD